MEELASRANSKKGRINCKELFERAKELGALNRIVTMYLDYAETQAEIRQIITMKDWVVRLDAFLQFNEKDILKNSGKVSTEIAKELAEKEFEKYEQQQRLIEATQPTSDFDKLLEKTKQIEKKAAPKKKSKIRK